MIVAAMDPVTVEICLNLRRVFSGRPIRLFVSGPVGAGKSLFIAALLAEAEEKRVPVRTLSPTTESEPILRDLARGNIGLLAVNRLDQLSPSVRTAVLQNRSRCAVGMLATAEHLSATTLSTLGDESDIVANVSGLEQRQADTLAISQLLWPGLCGEESDLIGNCLEEAAESLCRGPYPEGATSLRFVLAQLADALISSERLQGGEFRRQIEGRDIDRAVLATYRANYAAPQPISSDAVVVVEGSTDVTYLRTAAELALQERGWRLLDGCELRAAGLDRGGGAKAVWQRLIELRATSVDCVGLFDNDKVGRRECGIARDQTLQVELLPAEFDRLRLDNEERALEVEDLLSLAILDRFFAEHPGLDPEEIRWRNGSWRIVPQGNDKAVVAEWMASEMRIEDCERLVYVLCVLRKSLGLPLPIENLDKWRSELARSVPEAIEAVIARFGHFYG